MPTQVPQFEPIPAVDIRGGRCVRLLQGDFDRETVYGDDPVEMAKRWADAGATRLHVVDLDGARGGVRQNASVIERLLRTVSIPVQVGGGVRTLETARELVNQGAARVVVGTAAAEHPKALREWVTELTPERVVVGVDAKGGYVATRGWEHVTSITTSDFCVSLAAHGVIRVLYTDIGRDGMLQGPDVSTIRELVGAGSLHVIASGGVSTAEDLRVLAEAGAEGAIVGKALYDGRLTLDQARAAATGAPTC